MKAGSLQSSGGEGPQTGRTKCKQVRAEEGKKSKEPVQTDWSPGTGKEQGQRKWDS